MFEKALIPLDFKRSQKELSATLNLLQNFNTTSVHLLHVMSEGFTKKSRTQKYLDEIGQTLISNSHYEMKLTAEVREGHVATEISQAAKEADVDYIYIISGHRGFMYRTFLGSISRDVIRLTSKPTFVHKSRPRLQDNKFLTKILYATDFGPTAQKALPYVKKLGDLVDTIFILHVGMRAPDPFEEKARQQEVNSKLKELEEDLKDNFVNIEFISTIGSPYKEILKYSDQKKVELVILGRLSRPGPQNLMGSTSERVTESAHSSILLIP